MREQRIVLENHADVAAMGRDVHDIGAVDENFAAVGAAGSRR
jgi:hypothetical protein